MALKVSKKADKIEKKYSNGTSGDEEKQRMQLIKVGVGETVEDLVMLDMFPMHTKFGDSVMVVFGDLDGDKKADLPDNEMEYVLLGETGKGAGKRYHQQYGLFADLYNEEGKEGSVFGKMIAQTFGIFTGGDQDSKKPMAANFVMMNDKFRGTVVTIGKVKSQPKGKGMPYNELRYEFNDDEKLNKKAAELLEMYLEANPDATDKRYGEEADDEPADEETEVEETEIVAEARELLGKGKNKKSLTQVIQGLIDAGYDEADALAAAQQVIA